MESYQRTWDETNDGIKTILLSLLSFPGDVFTAAHFREPFFLVQIFFELAKIYGFSEVVNSIVKNVNISDLEKKRSFLTHTYGFRHP